MEIERRRLLKALAVGGLVPVSTAWEASKVFAADGPFNQPSLTQDGPQSSVLLASWQQEAAWYVGLVALNSSKNSTVDSCTWAIQAQHAVPTRAHGLLIEPEGHVLVLARRPGQWLMRWKRAGNDTPQWQWIEDDRRLNGHCERSVSDLHILTTETELEHAEGLLGVRDVGSLEKTAEWSTHGKDPHQILRLPEAVGNLPVGTLMVANGGIPTLPETGRSKLFVDSMDSSLVALHPQTGELLGQWRLQDRYLSIRHLAWNTMSKTLGLALQAEHPQMALRQKAPVLALWNASVVASASALLVGPALPKAGYAGDIVALPDGGFAVSCPRVNQVCVFDAQGHWSQDLFFEGAYALGRTGAEWWVGGTPHILRGNDQRAFVGVNSASHEAERVQWDNHWVAAFSSAS